MKLISMTDFVSNYTETGCLLKEINKIRNYASFLKQPLKLEMFVPCDEDGNVLEEPKHISETEFKMFEEGGLYKAYSENLSKYEQAKEKVLFEGFKDIVAIDYHISRNRTIEYLSKFSTIDLTQNAIKLLGS